jgi:hypothetical protein
MSLKQIFLKLSALQKFIRRGYATEALQVAEGIPLTHLLNRLYTILFEDIGIANVPLVKEILTIFFQRPDAKFNKDDVENVIRKMAATPKSRLLSYMTYEFRNAFLDLDASEAYEPYPIAQYDMINFSHPKYDFIRALHVAGMMYFKGMDLQFWKLMAEDLITDDDRDLAALVINVAHSFSQQGGRAEPMVWIFFLLWKYGKYGQGVEFPRPDDIPAPAESLVSSHNEKQESEYPDWVYDKHTSEGRAMNRGWEHFFKDGIAVNQLVSLPWVPDPVERESKAAIKKEKPTGTPEEKWMLFAKNFKISECEPHPLSRSSTYCQSSGYFYVYSEVASNVDVVANLAQGANLIHVQEHEPGDLIQECKFSYEEFLARTSPVLKPGQRKKFPRLQDLGTLQIPMTNLTRGTKNQDFVVYFWIEEERYVLKSHASRAAAKKIADADAMMFKYLELANQKLGTHMTCPQSQVICLEDCFSSPNKVKTERTYYTFSKALPYFLPATVGLEKWSASPARDQIILINLLKYIFGISDRTARNTGIWVDKHELHVCSFDHSGLLDEPDGPIIGKMGKSLEKYLQDEKNFIPEKEWFQNLEVDSDFYTRLAEVRTFLL